MIEPSLEPRRFLIRQDFNDHTFFVVWLAGVPKPWAIMLGTTEMYLTEKMGYNYQGADTLYFDTPENALKWWKETFEARA